MACGTAEAEARREDAGALHDAHVDDVTDGDAVAADLADGGEAVGEGVIGLLDGHGLLLGDGLDDPVVVIVGQVAGEMQVAVDEARHDGLAGDVADLIALGDLRALASVGDLGVVDEDKGVLDGGGAGAVNELAAYERVLCHGSSS